jgi:hypothetical protein
MRTTERTSSDPKAVVGDQTCAHQIINMMSETHLTEPSDLEGIFTTAREAGKGKVQINGIGKSLKLKLRHLENSPVEYQHEELHCGKRDRPTENFPERLSGTGANVGFHSRDQSFAGDLGRSSDAIGLERRQKGLAARACLRDQLRESVTIARLLGLRARHDQATDYQLGHNGYLEVYARPADGHRGDQSQLCHAIQSSPARGPGGSHQDYSPRIYAASASYHRLATGVAFRAGPEVLDPRIPYSTGQHDLLQAGSGRSVGRSRRVS